MSQCQRTIKSSFSIEGSGLHEGQAAIATVHPAEADTGFVFVRTDLENKPRIPFDTKHLGNEKRRTQIEAGGAQVHTCEHLIAGLYGCGVDNAIVELDGPEPPACDGSAKAFAEAVIRVGTKEQDGKLKVFKIKQRLLINDNGSSIEIRPDDGTSYEYTLDYGNAALPLSHVSHTWSNESFAVEIAGARTFCLEEEAMALRAAGFGKGANTQNTLVVGKDGPIENSLRWKDEYARHKLLDLIGDLALAGCRIEGKVVAKKSGHTLNQRMAADLSKAFEEGSMSEPQKEVTTLDPLGILALTPHRYPFLMVDRVVETSDDGKSLVGIKNVTFNEPYFQGHFPDYPIMPGVMQIEAMAQLGGLGILQVEDSADKVGMLTAVEKAKFRRAVVPGDQLRIEATIIRSRRGLVETSCRCTVDGELASQATIKFMLVEKDALNT